ncbi:MAG: hypothetical protein KJ771_06550, partial [Nanoarchaeota archaeon]|nr:hypothetical protein [Nanoarchaeota archaeon]
MVKKKKSKKTEKVKGRKLSKFWESVEHFNAKLIPFAILGLLFVIVVELFFKEFAEHYHTPILIVDYIVIAIFVVDLTFLAVQARSVKYFFKNYWLDIIAIVPFALFFTIISRLYQTVLQAGKLATGQAILHQTLET